MLLLLLGCIGLAPVGKDVSGGDDSGSATVGSLEIDASAIDFGDVELGQSVDRDLVLTNTGDGAIGVEIGITGDAFEVSTGSLSIETDEILLVTFSPATEGPYEGTLDLALDSGDTLSLPLTGNGVEEGGGGGGDTDTDEPSTGGPDIRATPTSHDFGNVDVDESSTTTFTVTNNGDEDLLISDVVSSNRAFTTGGTLSPPQVLSPGSTKLVDVTFTPTADTAYSGTITLVSDDPDTPELAISVEGTGVNLCDICSPLIDVDTGGSSPTEITDFFYTSFTGPDERTVTIRNVGDQDLEISSVTVNNDFLSPSGTFTVGGIRTPVTIAPYGMDTFTITFTATDTTVEVGQASLDMNVVHILSNDPTASDWVISLGGIAL